MKQYIRAELMLYMKNRKVMITGLVFWVVYLVLSVFSPVGGPLYSSLITVVGFIGVLYVFMPLLYTPGCFFNKSWRKQYFTQQLLLCLGESKRVYYVLRYGAFYLLLAGSVISATVMQLPAFLLFSSRYSLHSFGIEMMLLCALLHLFMVMICLFPARFMNNAMPLWCGLCGGVWGGIVGDGIGDKKGTEYYFRCALILCLIGFGLAVISMGYRYVVTVFEERGKKPGKR